jgi:hypothetical protein
MINLEKHSKPRPTKREQENFQKLVKARATRILEPETDGAESLKTYRLNVTQVSTELNAEVSVNAASYQELLSLILEIKGDEPGDYYITYEYVASVSGQSEDRAA